MIQFFYSVNVDEFKKPIELIKSDSYHESYYNLRKMNDQLQDMIDDKNVRSTWRVSRVSMRNTIQIREQQPDDV